MDAALLRERELFKMRAMALPVVESKSRKKETKPDKSDHKKRPKPSSSASSQLDPLSYKSMQASSQYKFAILAKIVKFMKQRHMDGDSHPLSLEEILDETNQLDVGTKHRHWLATEALVNNPKINFIADNLFAFKPPYNLKDKKSLLRLLDKHDQKGLGGIMYEDIVESLPNAEKAVKNLGDSIVIITRTSDKKKVIFYNDKSSQIQIDEDFQKLWRSVPVDGLDDGKIEEYLDKQGISSMQDMGVKKLAIQKRKKSQKRRGNFKRLNEHMMGVLEDYSEK